MLIMDLGPEQPSPQISVLCSTNYINNNSNNYNHNDHYATYSASHHAMTNNNYESAVNGSRQDDYRQQLHHNYLTSRSREQSNNVKHLHYASRNDITSKFQHANQPQPDYSSRTVTAETTGWSTGYYDQNGAASAQPSVQSAPSSSQLVAGNNRYFCGQNVAHCNNKHEHQQNVDSTEGPAFNYSEQYFCQYSQSAQVTNSYPITNCYVGDGVAHRLTETENSINVVGSYHQLISDDRAYRQVTDYHVTAANDQCIGLNNGSGRGSPYGHCYSANVNEARSNHLLTYNNCERVAPNEYRRHSSQTSWTDQFVGNNSQQCGAIDERSGSDEPPSHSTAIDDAGASSVGIPTDDSQDRPADTMAQASDRPALGHSATIVVDSFGPNNNSFKIAGQIAARRNQCSICGRNYARPSTLKTHLRTHTNERPFKCNICSKTFSQAANLTAHQRVHTGERPFSCPICSRQFSQSSSVITHLRTHSGERPYRCNLCTRTFSDSSTLTKHCRIHSGEKPYHCDYCPLNFSQSGNLSRHLKLHLVNNNNNITSNHGDNSGAQTAKTVSKTCATSTN